MLFGKATQLWLGLITAGGAAIQVLVIALVPTIDAAQVALVIGAIVGFLGVLIAFLANQPPAVIQGGTINVTTPAGEPNVLATVNSPTSLTPVGSVKV